MPVPSSIGAVTAKRPGRRPGESTTRAAIVAAARALLAERGADAASVRSIAKDAGVDPSLVLHYFGSKLGLFIAALETPFDAEEVRERVVAGPRAELGKRLAQFFLSTWDHPERRDVMMALLRAATTNPDAARMLRERVGERVLLPVGEHLGVPDAPLRMSLCAAHLVGVGITRYIVGIEPIASIEKDRLADLVAPALQRYMTGPLEI